MLKKLFIFCCLTFSVVVAKKCTDFDKDDNIIGEHTAWFHCVKEDGKAGTVNSCDCNVPFSIECRRACKKPW